MGLSKDVGNLSILDLIYFQFLFGNEGFLGDFIPFHALGPYLLADWSVVIFMSIISSNATFSMLSRCPRRKTIFRDGLDLYLLEEKVWTTIRKSSEE